ncbi:hypothetical protein OsJ_22786 [Oryza sativa Japonica Group]|uniref:Fe2OG dioxygenase domain-containing protein n=1 Tax=Oryza sativa subsp. japonica TaxID=39947 RepID=A3BFR9_ORYSJ|nr:hypothetical protein OsJ_22786 [Oryza sativa Japonica Group]
MEEHDYDSNSNPPLMSTYKHLFVEQHRLDMDMGAIDVDECELPVIDLAGLMEAEQVCRADMVRAASEWGFFQVTNHGVPQALLRELHDAQVAVFRRPFQEKVTERLLGFSPGKTTGPSTSIRARAVIEEVSRAMYELAQKLAEILMRGLPGAGEGETMVTTREETCFLRLNRYPPCAMAMGGFGLCPHTDSDLLTIVHQQQDTVGGLQLLKGGRWVAVKPSPSTLIVNVGDLLQAWSNDVYKSVEHRVMANATLERFSMAFFLCPSYHTLIIPSSSHVHDDDAHYRSFTFGEYRKQIMEDVRSTGRKIGLHRFRTR